MSQAFVPGFDYDVFISYATATNTPTDLKDESTGWVHQFRQYLEHYLNEKLMRYKGQAKIFQDTYSIRQQKDFQPQLDSAVENAAVMLALLHGAYLGSDFCVEELKRFNETLGGRANQSGRLFPVFQEAIEDWDEDVRSVVDNVRGFDMYKVDPVKKIPRRHRIASEEFFFQLEEIRERLAGQLIKLWKERTAATESTEASADAEWIATVYLAEGVGIGKKRAELAGHLRSARIRVLPENPYPRAADKFRLAMKADLQNADVFVQLFGNASTARTDNLPRGYEGLQLLVAQELQTPVYQWRNPKFDPDEVDTSDHIEMAAQAEYFGSLLDFAQAIRTKLGRMAKAPMKAESRNGKTRQALIKFSPKDREMGESLSAHLGKHNILCEPTSNGLNTRESLRETQYDAVVTVCGECDEDWIKEQVKQIKVVVLDMKEQAPVCAFFLPPDGSPPLFHRTIFPAFDGDKTSLQRLIDAIHARGGAK